MTKDELHQTAAEQNNKAPETKKEAVPAPVVQARPPAGPMPPAPRPFGMPVMPMMPVAKNIKVSTPYVLLKNDIDTKGS